MGDDDDFIMEEFEWALKDPTEEKLRQLGEVVSIITGKLIDAFGQLERRLDDIESQVSALGSRIDSLSSRSISAGPSGAADEAPAMASAPIAKAPSPKASSGGGGGMMGELKALLAARRQKSDGSTETSPSG
jgi:hypothetical protein